MSISTWVSSLDTWKKLLAYTFFLLVVGWSANVIFAQQVGLPAAVIRNTNRVTDLEGRMETVEDAVTDIQTNSASLAVLRVQVDSLKSLADDTYCLVRAHALDLNPLAECTLSRHGSIR